MKHCWFYRILSAVIVLALLSQMLPARCFLKVNAATQEDSRTEANKALWDAPAQEETKPEIYEEIISARSEYSKEYRMSNGLRMAVLYPTAVHYEKDGRWEEIDNTLQVTGRGVDAVYRNTAGAWEVCLPQTMTGHSPVSVTKDGYTMRFTMAGQLRQSGDYAVEGVIAGEAENMGIMSAQGADGVIQSADVLALKSGMEYPETYLEKLSAALKYDDVFPNTSIRYDLHANELKESVILEKYDASVRGYRYTLQVGALVPVLLESGEINLYTPDGKTVVYTMPAPYMVDAAEEHCADVQVELTGSGNVYTLTYWLPANWLAEESRAWPVILDPVITVSDAFLNVEDVTVAQKGGITYTSGALMVGYRRNYGLMRTFLRYTELPALTSADVVVGASLQMLEYEGTAGSMTVEVHKVNDVWRSSGITWENQPEHNSIVEDFANVDGGGYWYWDVTDIVREWYSGENTGMVFTASNESSTSENWKKFYASDYSTWAKDRWPTLNILFRNNNGLEGYWDYTSSVAGRAGTGYVNSYTGNLIWIRGDIGFGGNRMPVSISHIYNANDSGNNDFAMGYGWRTNFNQLVYRWSENSDYYVWEDPDGTDHYFCIGDGGTYEDEDGLELTLTDGGSGNTTYCITDQHGNKSYFDGHGRLTKQENFQKTKSTITVTYTTDTGKQISTITDGAGRVYAFTYTGGLLSRVTYRGGGSSEVASVSYSYTDGLLNRVTDADGKYSEYAYQSGRLMTTATDVDGYKICYTYNTSADQWQPHRVQSVAEYDGEKVGGTLRFEYAHNQTILTDHNGNQKILQFNNWGNTVSVQDDQGRAQFAKYAADANENGKGNQLSLSSKLQNTVGNLLVNNDLEYEAIWSDLNSAVSHTITSEAFYHGRNSMKIHRSTAGIASGVVSEAFSVEAGKSYTFSAYVKTGAASAYLSISDGESEVVSQTLPGNTDWTRLQVTYTNTSSAAKTATARLLTKDAGTVYMDAVQVEQAETASRYNLISNGDFSRRSDSGAAHGWTKFNASGQTEGLATVTGTPAAPELDSQAFRFVGDPMQMKSAYQTVLEGGKAGDTFVLAGWAKGDSVPLRTEGEQERRFSILASFNYEDDTCSPAYQAKFNADTDSQTSWQYASTTLVAQKDYSSVAIWLMYEYNANTVYFDGVQLYKEEYGNSYTYDEDGNVISVQDLQGQTTSYEYTNNDLTAQILPTGAKLTYTYDDYHNVKTATTEEGLVYEFAYDDYGNNTSVSVKSGGSAITATAAYSADGNRLVSATDALGKVTKYSYHADTNVLEWVQYPEDTEATRTEYTYDGMYRMAKVEANTNTGSNLFAQYTYEDDLLTSIQTASTTYTFAYGDFARRTSVKAGSRTLASYEYTDDQNGYLDTLRYGNGDFVTYEYDKQGRVTKQSYEDNSYVTYRYDNSGALATVYDSETDRTTTYYYDFTDRMMKYVESGDNYSHSVGYEYDKINNLTALVETINGVKHTTSYAYDQDNRITSVTADGTTKSYTYDGYGRVTQRITKRGEETVLTETLTYWDNANGAPTSQVKTHRTQSAGYDVTNSYTYDGNGNILTISDGTYTTTYTYDSANQLIRENNQQAGKTWTWSYDSAGNVLEESTFDYTTGYLETSNYDFAYDYADTAWGDLLTAYDDFGWKYDAIGNVTDDSTYVYTWKHGRQLVSMEESGTVYEMTYDANGMRTGQRIYDEATNELYNEYQYVYNGSQLTQMIVDGNTLDFTYDASGTPLCVKYNGTTYYYVTNLQGDVVAILDGTGAAVVRYSYDAWGSNTSNRSGTGTLASTLGRHNPLRYRGYVCDIGTGLYYLQSRYYEPFSGRFLNADAYASTGQGILGNNMFAYCGNNPTCRSDHSGHAWGLVALGIALVALLTGCSNSEDSNESSPEELAAFEAGKQVRKRTNQDNNEYICGVYKLKSGEYLVGSCFMGEHSSVSVGPVLREAGSYSDRTLVAFVHSHPYCTNHVPNQFSQYGFDNETKKMVTIGDLAVAAETQLPIYLAAPDGNLYVMHATNLKRVGDSVVWDYVVRCVMSGLPKDETIFDCGK